jgi:hypothetical protein
MGSILLQQVCHKGSMAGRARRPWYGRHPYRRAESPEFAVEFGFFQGHKARLQFKEAENSFVGAQHE